MLSHLKYGDNSETFKIIRKVHNIKHKMSTKRTTCRQISGVISVNRWGSHPLPLLPFPPLLSYLVIPSLLFPSRPTVPWEVGPLKSS